MPARTHAVPLPVVPGGEYEAWVRVQTAGGMTVPVVLARPELHPREALREQMPQGLVVVLGLCLLLDSRAHWITLCEPLFVESSGLASGPMRRCRWTYSPADNPAS